MTGGDERQGDDAPFARHRAYYLALKLAVLVAAVALGTKLLGWW